MLFRKSPNKPEPILTVCLAVCDSRPGVGVVRVPLGVQVVQKHINFVLGQQRRHRLHVVVAQTVMMGIRVLAVQHRVMVRHPPRLIRRCDFHCSALFSSETVSCSVRVSSVLFAV